MAQAAHTLAVNVSATLGGSYAAIDGLNDASLQRAIDLLETTDYADTTGQKTRIPGLGDATISLSGDREQSDTNGQNIVRAAAFSKGSIGVQFLPDGTNGQKALFYVQDYRESGPVADKVSFSFTLQKTGAFTAVP